MGQGERIYSSRRLGLWSANCLPDPREICRLSERDLLPDLRPIAKAVDSIGGLEKSCIYKRH